MRSLALPVIALAVLAPAANAAPAAAHLRLACSTPNAHRIVTCRVAGYGFRPGEAVRLTYRVTVDSTAKPRHDVHAYARRAGADAHGSFVRPAFGFGLGASSYAYHLNVTAIGNRGSRASVGSAGIAN